jgi:hypothetical protein
MYVSYTVHEATQRFTVLWHLLSHSDISIPLVVFSFFLLLQSEHLHTDIFLFCFFNLFPRLLPRYGTELCFFLFWNGCLTHPHTLLTGYSCSWDCLFACQINWVCMLFLVSFLRSRQVALGQPLTGYSLLQFVLLPESGTVHPSPVLLLKTGLF